MPVSLKKKTSDAVPLYRALETALDEYNGELGIRRHGITQSLMANLLLCPIRGVLSLGRWTHISKAKTTRFGSLSHAVLDNSYALSAPPSARQRETMIDRYVERHINDWQCTGDEALAEVDAAVVSALFQNYYQHFEEDWTRKEFEFSEGVFDYRIDGVRRRGKIDGAYREAKRLKLIEHKTKGQIDVATLLLHLGFDFQNQWYADAFDHMHKPDSVSGVLYNVIRRTGKKPHKGERLSVFRSRLCEEIRKNRKHFFMRFPIEYSPIDRTRFRAELIPKFSRVKQILAGDIWKNEFACTPFRCQFLDACATKNMSGCMQIPKLFPELGEEKSLL